MEPPSRTEFARFVGTEPPNVPNELLLTWVSEANFQRNGQFQIRESALGKLANQTIVDVSEFSLSASLIDSLSRSKDLRWLRLSDDISGEDLVWIAYLSDLRGLSLAGADLRDGDLTLLANLRHLQWLDLRFTQLPTRSPLIPAMPELQCLFLDYSNFGSDHCPITYQAPRLKSLSLKGVSAGDWGIRETLRHTPRLTFLHLAHAKKVSSASFQAISELERLKFLHLGGSELSVQTSDSGESFVALLRTALPHCFVDTSE